MLFAGRILSFSNGAAATIAALLVSPSIAVSQTAISAQAGMINHIEGRVLLQDEPLLDHPGRFLHVEPGQRLRTEQGRAEILFALGSYLRLADDGEIEMDTAGLTSARVRLRRGSMMVESHLVYDEDSLMVLVGDVEVRILKKGLYRLDVTEQDEATLRVLKGEALVLSHSVEQRVSKKQAVQLGIVGEVVSVEDFKHWEEDELSIWSAKRAAVLERETARFGKLDRRKPTGDMLDALPDRNRAGIPYY